MSAETAAITKRWRDRAKIFSSLEPKFKPGLLPRTGRSKSEPLAPLSAVQKVKHSWSVVSSDLNGVGVDFFTRFLLDAPAAIDLFVNALSLDEEEVTRIKSGGDERVIRQFVRENMMLQAHARLVVAETGRCVAGLDDGDVLVPRLRSLGRMHKAAGILPAHYDVFFEHMIATVKDRVKDVNPNAWDGSTAEAWRTVGDNMHRILSKPDAEVGSIEGGSRLTIWDTLCGGASFYTCIVTPLRIAGMVGSETRISLSKGTSNFIHGLRNYEMSHHFGLGLLDYRKNYEMSHHFGLGLLDLLVVAIFAVEIFGFLLLRVTDFRDLRRVRSKKKQKARLLGMGIAILHSLGIQESVMHPKTDFVFLLSYFFQHHTGGESALAQLSTTPEGEPIKGKGKIGNLLFQHHNDLASIGPSHEDSLRVGTDWMWALGMLRLVMIRRAVRFLKRLELAYTIRRRADSFTRSPLHVGRLILGLFYACHLTACVYVLVARIELGPRAIYGENPEELASSFFPDYTILGSENDMLTNYLRCVHFAFTNLAGIGNHESIPHSALECAFTLVVNALGATLYAFVTGLLLSTIEPHAERANQFGDSIAALSDFMTEVGLPSEKQGQFIQGFILREINESSRESDENVGPFASVPGENATSPDYPRELVGRLPRYLQDELHVVALVDAMKRRERAFRGCGDGFLTALAATLKPSIALLPGDYLLREGQDSPSQLLIVERGTLRVAAGEKHVRTLQRGDVISFRWADASGKFPSNVSALETDGYSPLLLGQATAFASVRAMDHCVISAGLMSRSEADAIKKIYPADWKQVEGVLDSARFKIAKKARMLKNAITKMEMAAQDKDGNADKQTTSSALSKNRKTRQAKQF